MSQLRRCAKDIAAAVFADCGVDGIEWEITQAVYADVADGAPLPDADTVAKLVSGDDDGEVPAELKKLYPNIDFVLESKCK